MTNPLSSRPALPEEISMWKKFVVLMNDFDPDWFMTDRTEKQYETGKQTETTLTTWAQELKARGWDIERYYNAKIKAIRHFPPLTTQDIKDLVENPAVEKYDGWRLRDD